MSKLEPSVRSLRPLKRSRSCGKSWEGAIEVVLEVPAEGHERNTLTPKTELDLSTDLDARQSDETDSFIRQMSALLLDHVLEDNEMTGIIQVRRHERRCPTQLDHDKPTNELNIEFEERDLT